MDDFSGKIPIKNMDDDELGVVRHDETETSMWVKRCHKPVVYTIYMSLYIYILHIYIYTYILYIYIYYTYIYIYTYILYIYIYYTYIYIYYTYIYIYVLFSVWHFNGSFDYQRLSEKHMAPSSWIVHAM